MPSISQKQIFSPSSNTPFNKPPIKLSNLLEEKTTALSKILSREPKPTSVTPPSKAPSIISWKNAGKVMGLSLLILGIDLGVRQALKEKPLLVRDPGLAAITHVSRMTHICNTNFPNLNTCQTNTIGNHFTALCPYQDPLEFFSSLNFEEIESQVKGQLKCPNDLIYEGNFQIERLTNEFNLQDQAVIKKIVTLVEGSFKTNSLEGQGTYKFPNGDEYKGNFVNFTFEGEGTYRWANGDEYKGNFKVGFRDGQGTRTYSDGKVYTGSFKDGKREGSGKLTFPNGEVYEGAFANDQIEGYGIYQWPNGDIYRGEFHNGQEEGWGRKTFHYGEEFSGMFKKGKREGEGTYKTSHYVFDGSYRNDVRDGYGKITYHNGDKYLGYFSQGQIEGQGTYQYLGGDYYQGGFKNGLRVGVGLYVRKDKSWWMGQWKEDKQGWGVFYSHGYMLRSENLEYLS